VYNIRAWICYHPGAYDEPPPLSRRRLGCRRRCRAARPVNVILIYCDDLGWGDLSCYGSPIATPHIDRLAHREGARFTHCLSANPVCSPSRAALLTGRYPTRVGYRGCCFRWETTQAVAEGEQTIAQLLKAKGYQTMCVGKWHLGHLPPHLPTYKGFDHYYGIPYSNDMNPRWLMADEKVLEEQTDLDTLQEKYTKRAVEFIAGAKDKPFFLYMPHTYPHIPFGVGQAFRGKSKQGIYGDVLSELDWSVGQILAALEKHKLDRDTLVLFSSDNGPVVPGQPRDAAGAQRDDLGGRRPRAAAGPVAGRCEARAGVRRAGFDDGPAADHLRADRRGAAGAASRRPRYPAAAGGRSGRSTVSRCCTSTAGICSAPGGANGSCTWRATTTSPTARRRQVAEEHPAGQAGAVRCRHGPR
jgi:arylsulfatase A-like enzyme